MTLIRKIGLTYGLLFALTLLCAGMAFWSSLASSYHLERADLAHRSYEAHLNLSNHSYQLFTRFALATLTGDPEMTDEKEALVTLVNNDIAKIRNIVSAEIKLVGEKEVEELAALAALETNINHIIEDFRQFATTSRPSDLFSLESDSTETLRLQINEQIRKQIGEALAGELEEVSETRADALALLNRFRAISILLGALSIVLTIASFFTLFQQIANPLQKIIHGAKRYAESDFSHRINLQATGELKNIADAVDSAAAATVAREHNLTQTNRRLEDEVQRQTAELRQALLELEEQANNRRRLLADVSHELRTPLTVIQGEADIALRGGEKDKIEYKEALRRAGEAAKHTATLVNDLLFISRQESGESRLNMRQSDLVEITKETIENLQSLFVQKKILIELTPEVSSAPLRVDVSRIQQVMMILLENACHYGGENILVRIFDTPGGYATSIKDDGPGISKHDLNHLFERFFRGSNASERYASGTGIGLPVAKSIIEAHGGAITVGSVPGDGAEFTITLPGRSPLKAVS